MPIAFPSDVIIELDILERAESSSALQSPQTEGANFTCPALNVLLRWFSSSALPSRAARLP